MDLTKETSDFAFRLDWYRSQSRVPDVWFDRPDSLEVIAEDIADFEHLVKDPAKEMVVQEPTDDEHFLVAAKLAGKLQVGLIGRIEWVEIEEPSEVTRAIGNTGVKNLNFFYDDLESVRYLLGIRGIVYDLVDFEDHEMIKVLMDAEGNSFSLYNRPMDSYMQERMMLEKVKVIGPKQIAA